MRQKHKLGIDDDDANLNFTLLQSNIYDSCTNRTFLLNFSKWQPQQSRRRSSDFLFLRLNSVSLSLYYFSYFFRLTYTSKM